MALRFCDGFDHYATADITKKWTGLIGNTPGIGAYGRFGTSGVQGSGGNQDSGLIKTFTSGGQVWIVGAAWKTDYASVANWVWSFRNGGTYHLSLRFDSTQRFYVYNHATSASSSYSPLTYTPGGWYYIEMKVKIDNTNGGVWVRINGVDQIRLGAYALTPVGLDTLAGAGSAIADTIIFGNINGSNCSWNGDDVYMCDDSGSANNDFLGDIRVQTILPTADGGTNEWTASAGSRYDCVNDPTLNSVTDYIQSGTTVGNKNTFAFGNVTPTSGTVKGVQILIGAMKDDAGSRSIAPVYGNGTPASDVDGATVSVGDAYIYYSEIKEQDPVAAADWTISSVNAAEFGVKLTA